MRARLSGALVLAVAVGLAACGGGAPSNEFTKEDSAQIRQLVNDFVTAYNARDVEKIGSLFSGTGTIMPPNRSTLRGVDLVKGYYEGRLKEEGATDLVFDELSMDGVGTPWYVVVTYQLKLRPQGGPEERFRGKNVWVLRSLAGSGGSSYRSSAATFPRPRRPHRRRQPSRARVLGRLRRQQRRELVGRRAAG